LIDPRQRAGPLEGLSGQRAEAKADQDEDEGPNDPAGRKRNG
jgi:hypothetical protein